MSASETATAGTAEADQKEKPRQLGTVKFDIEKLRVEELASTRSFIEIYMPIYLSKTAITSFKCLRMGSF